MGTGPRIDLTSNVYDRLTVLGFAEMRQGRSFWRCRCTCGNECVVNGADLKLGKIHSCGCLRREMTTKHGQIHTPLYHISGST